MSTSGYRLRADQPLAEAGQTIVAALRTQLRAAEPGVRDGDDEALHDMRVATRRMRAVLGLLHRAFPRRRLKPLRRSLKALSVHLGAVRDLDVLLGLVAPDQQDETTPAPPADIVDDWRGQRAEARQKLLAFLDGVDYRALHEQIDGLLASGVATERGTRRACDSIPTLIQRRYAKVRAFEPRVPVAELTELHELRKESKKLRYALEALRQLLGARADKLIARLVALQDTLGALHDDAVLRARLEDYVRERGDSDPHVAMLLDRTRLDLAERRIAFERLWARMRRRRFRRRLGRALASP